MFNFNDCKKTDKFINYREMLYLVVKKKFFWLNLMIYILLLILKHIYNIYVPMSSTIGFINMSLITFLLAFYFNNCYTNYLTQYDLLCELKQYTIYVIINVTDKQLNNILLEQIFTLYIMIILYIFKDKQILKGKQLNGFEDILLYGKKMLSGNKTLPDRIQMYIDNIIGCFQKINDRKIRNSLINYNKSENLLKVYSIYMNLLLYSFLFIFNFAVISNIEIVVNNTLNILSVVFSVLIVVMTNLFYIGIKKLSEEIIDPHGDDVVDLDLVQQLKYIHDIRCKLCNNIGDKNYNNINGTVINDIYFEIIINSEKTADNTGETDYPHINIDDIEICTKKIQNTNI